MGDEKEDLLAEELRTRIAANRASEAALLAAEAANRAAVVANTKIAEQSSGEPRLREEWQAEARSHNEFVRGHAIRIEALYERIAVALEGLGSGQ